jgi:DNA polymerase III sliding clamp (beta) subunit (PCNA family)
LIVDRLPHEISTTIPVKSTDEIIRALHATDEDTVLIGHDEDHVVVEIGQDVIVAQRLLVPYPSVEPLFLGATFSNDITLTVARRDLAEAIKRVRVNADPDSATISLTVTPGKGSDPLAMSWVLVIQAHDRDRNASKEAMLCRWTGGQTRTLTLNHRYLSELLAILTEDVVHLKVGPDAKTIKSPVLVETPEMIAVIQQTSRVF